MIFLGVISFVEVERDPRSHQIKFSWGMTEDKVRKAEFYPFSSFSMYSDFSDSTYYIWLADQDGKPFPARALNSRGNISTSQIKKIYARKLDVLKNSRKDKGLPQKADLAALKHEAGMDALRTLRQSMVSPDFEQRHPGLRLTFHEVTVSLDNARIT